MARASKQKIRTATHRPAIRRRRFRHDDLVAVDLFSGFGGLTEGIRRAGFTTIMAANHNRYKVLRSLVGAIRTWTTQGDTGYHGGCDPS